MGNTRYLNVLWAPRIIKVVSKKQTTIIYIKPYIRTKVAKKQIPTYAVTRK